MLKKVKHLSNHIRRRLINVKTLNLKSSTRCSTLIKDLSRNWLFNTQNLIVNAVERLARLLNYLLSCSIAEKHRWKTDKSTRSNVSLCVCLSEFNQIYQLITRSLKRINVGKTRSSDVSQARITNVNTRLQKYMMKLEKDVLTLIRTILMNVIMKSEWKL